MWYWSRGYAPAGVFLLCAVYTAEFRGPPVSVLNPVAKSLTVLSGIVLVFGFLPGCRDAPNAPTDDSLLISGYVYQGMRRGSGEPPIPDAVITVKAADGRETRASSDDRGFYTVRAVTGAVLVTAAKSGYTTRESRFEVEDSTVLNFSLMPTTTP